MIVWLLSWSLLAQTMVIPDVNLDSETWQKYQLTHPNTQSHTQWLMSERSSTLLFSLQKAQYAFVSGDIDGARTLFNSMIQQLHNSDWSKEDQKALHYALTRLAQLSVDSKLQKKLLQAAIDFAPQALIDPVKFPPPLVEDYKKILDGSSETVWSLPDWSRNYQWVLINGQPQKLQGPFLKTRTGVKRFTFLSDRYESHSLVQTIETLQKIKHTPLALVSGNCQNPQWSSKLPQNLEKIYVTDDCQSAASQKSPAVLTAFQPNPQPQPSTQHWTRSKWFWIGAALVGAGVLVSLEAQKKDSSPMATQPIPVFTN